MPEPDQDSARACPPPARAPRAASRALPTAGGPSRLLSRPPTRPSQAGRLPLVWGLSSPGSPRAGAGVGTLARGSVWARLGACRLLLGRGPGWPRPGAGQPHLSLGKLSLGKAWDRARFPRSFRCTRPPSPARGRALSWLSVRSLDSGHDQFPVSGRLGRAVLRHGQVPRQRGHRRQAEAAGRQGRSPGAAYLRGCRRGAPPSPPGTTPVGPTVSHGSPDPSPGGPLLCWPRPCTPRTQGPELGTGRTDWPHPGLRPPSVFQGQLGSQRRGCPRLPRRNIRGSQTSTPDSATTGRAAWRPAWAGQQETWPVTVPVKPGGRVCQSLSSLTFQMKMPPHIDRGMKIPRPATAQAGADTAPPPH